MKNPIIIICAFFLLGKSFAGSKLLHHRKIGQGTEVVILLHHWLGSGKTWDPVIPYLDQTNFTYLVADVRGYGGSSHLMGSFTAAEIGADVIALAENDDVDCFHIVGHSMTGLVVQRLMLDFPQRLQSAILVTPATSEGLPIDEPTRQFFHDIPGHEKIAAEAFAGLTGNVYGAQWGQVKARQMMQATRADVMKAYLSMVLDQTFEEDFTKPSSVPSLVISGSNDFPWNQKSYYQRELANELANATYVEISGVGHYPMDEATIKLASLINEFLGQNMSTCPLTINHN